MRCAIVIGVYPGRVGSLVSLCRGDWRGARGLGGA